MITLADTKYGMKRKAIIGGVSFDVLQKNCQISFYVQLIDSNNNLLDDQSIYQNRAVSYNLNNQNRVDNQFNVVQINGTGEYDFFFNLLQTVPLPNLILQLAEKLKQRGIFN